MPNHIANVITFNASPERVAEVRQAIAGTWEDAPHPIDFNRIIPRPPSLNVNESSESRIAAWEMRSVYKPRYGVSEPYPHEYANASKQLIEQCKENIRLHGFPTWYEWSCQKWGTKWNAYDQEERAPNVIKFETAWSTPEPIFAALAARFPDVSFTVEYADEDIGSNQGTLVYRDGCLAERNTLPGNYTNPERRQFAYRLHGYDAETIAEMESDDE